MPSHEVACQRKNLCCSRFASHLSRAAHNARRNLQETTQATECRATARHTSGSSPSWLQTPAEGTADACSGEGSEVCNVSGGVKSEGPEVNVDAADVEMEAEAEVKEAAEPAEQL